MPKLRFKDLECQQWYSIPRRYSGAPQHDQNVLRLIAFELAKEAAKATGSNLRVNLSDIDPMTKERFRWIAGSEDWQDSGQLRRAYRFLTVLDGYLIGWLAGIEADLNLDEVLAQNSEQRIQLRRAVERADPPPKGAFVHRLWVSEAVGDIDVTGLLDELRLGRQKHEGIEWLPLPYGAIGVPSDLSDDWVLIILPEHAEVFRYNFTFYLWPEIVFRIGRCIMYAEKCLRDAQELESTLLPNSTASLPLRENQLVMIQSLQDRSEAIARLHHDAKTVQVNANGLRNMCGLDEFKPDGARLADLLAGPAERELQQIAIEIDYLEIGYEKLDREEKLIGTQATIRAERWQKKLTILGAAFAAAGIAQLVPEGPNNDPTLRLGVFFGLVLFSLVVIVFWGGRDN